jgi:outer membrane receptor for ferrienterochelin and colicins
MASVTHGLYVVLLLVVFPFALEAQLQTGTVIVVVRSSHGDPVPQVEVEAGNQVALTDDRGEAMLQVPAGETEISFERYGFSSKNIRVTVSADETSRIAVELEPQAVIRESIVVTATRSDVRIEDEPLRVEVVDRDEVEEKAVMTPGDIAMLLNETSGLRVQVTSPSLGAANVRVQGLRGRYTQLLADGLPLYGEAGSIGILQIPPLDLGQVEVIKGVASALYGASALGGVVNLVSRRPQKEREQQLLLNATSREGSDAVFWLAEPAKNRWSHTLLAGAHLQRQSDIDHDGWADLPEYQRGILRPRFFWEDGSGNSLFVTTGPR